MAVSAILTENETNCYEEAKNQILSNSILLCEEWRVPTIIAGYLIFIFLGNRIMRTRSPFHLKLPIAAFNIFQISYNIYMFYQGMGQRLFFYCIHHACHPKDPSKNEVWFEAYELAHLFFASKLFDFIDTVFLVLCKKVEHISFLHLYHHVSMAITAWIVVKLGVSLGEQLYIVVMLNSMVHVFMYLYYFLSLLGPSIHKYLWWKKYVTMLQLVQFMIYIVYMLALLAFGCSQPKATSAYALCQGVIFFELFRKFYNQHYKRPSSSAVKFSNMSEDKKK